MNLRKKKLFKIYLTLSIFLILFFILIIPVLKNYFIYSSIKTEYDKILISIKKEKEKLKLNKKKEKEEEEKMKIEKEILNTHMLKRKGENVIKLID